jgi:uncharacterized protein (UPF0276 family)
MVPEVEYVTEVVKSSAVILKLDMTSASISAISDGLKDSTTVAVTSMEKN